MLHTAGMLKSTLLNMIFLQVTKKKTPSLTIPASSRTPRHSFRGAFFCQAYDTQQTINATFTRGYVNGIEPTIERKLISSGAILKAPINYDAFNRCYIGVNVKVDPNTGKMLATTQAKAEQYLKMEVRGNNLNDSPDEFFHPVAIWHKTEGLYQLTYHDLMHMAITQFHKPRHLMFAS
jgi:hypothetical protein